MGGAGWVRARWLQPAAHFAAEGARIRPIAQHRRVEPGAERCVASWSRPGCDRHPEAIGVKVVVGQVHVRQFPTGFHPGAQTNLSVGSCGTNFPPVSLIGMMH